MKKTYIKSIKLNGYRTYYREQIFAPVYPRRVAAADGDGRNLIGYNVVVGPNAGGKTSLLDLISMAESPRFFSEDKTTSTVLVETVLSDDRTVSYDGDDVSRSGYNGQGGLRIQKITTDGKGVACVGGRNDALPAALPDGKWAPSSSRVFFGSALGDCYSTLRRGTNVIGMMNVIVKANMANALQEFMKGLMPDVFGFEINHSRDDRYQVLFKGARGAMVGYDNLSEGSKVILQIGLYLFGFQNPSIGLEAPDCLIVDEPEKSLQPVVQKKIYSMLKNLSRYAQVIVATHSPYFVSWSDLMDGAAIHRIYRSADGSSQINTVSEVDEQKWGLRVFGSLKAPRRMHHYSVSSRESLFHDACLLTEGQEDALILRNFAAESDLDLPYEVFGYGADGAGNIKGWVHLLSELGIRVGALFDGDKHEEAEVVRKILGHDLVTILKMDDIRDKFDKKGNVIKTGIAYEEGCIKEGEESYTKDLLEKIGEALVAGSRRQYLSWKDVASMSAELAEKIQTSYSGMGEGLDYLLVLPRGGYFPALVIAQQLKMGSTQMLHACLQTYRLEGTDRAQEAKWGQMPPADLVKGKNIVIVDDVCDSGNSLSMVKSKLDEIGANSVRSATLHYKPRSSQTDFVPDFYIDAVDEWLVYPWECGL